MASIWKRDNSPWWYACITTADGRQVKYSLKKAGLKATEKNRDKAQTAATELERAETMAKQGIATEARFRELLSQILERISGGEESLRSKTVREYLKDWLENKDLAEASEERYQRTIDLFLEHLKERAERPIAAVTPGLIQSFVTARRKQGVAPKTLSVDVKTLGTAFNRAKREGMISYNPVEAVELPDIESASREPFTAEQIRMLIGKAPSDDWKTVIMLGAFTGARLRDCANMEWESVNLLERTIEFTPLKTGKKMKIPMHTELEIYLQSIAAKDTALKHLAQSLQGRKTGGAHGLSQKFKDIMKDAGIDTGHADSKGKRQLSKRTFHSLRHTFNSALANAGVPQELRMKLTGHSSEDMNKRYTHHELDTLRAAVAKVPGLDEPKKK